MLILMRRLAVLTVLALASVSGPARSEAPTARETPSVPVTIDDAALIEALTFGITAEDFARMQAMGRESWLDAQLHPGPDLQLPLEAQAAIEPFQDSGTLLERFSAYGAQVRVISAMPDGEERRRVSKEVGTVEVRSGERAVARTILAALYSPDQLRERMTWFWLNHFNVYLHTTYLRMLAGDYVDTTIRPHALGRFRDLLGAILRHPAMLGYLDNANNTAQRHNENYARELLELHTLGVNGGYTQADVEQLARILTGVGYGFAPEPRMPPDRQRDYRREGLFVFDPTQHDYGDKAFLGRTIKGRGFAEVEEALDILARHPATARNVSTSIARSLLGAEPSPELVGRLARAFIESDGDIARVIGALVRDPDFAAGVGQGLKDPFRYVLSGLRLGFPNRTIRNPILVQSWLRRLGAPLLGRTTPDGYPLDAAAWNGPGQMVARFEVARMIGGGNAGLFASPVDGSLPEGPKPAPPIYQTEFFETVLRGRFGAPTLAVLAQAKPGLEWNTLFLASPEFMRGPAPPEPQR